MDSITRARRPYVVELSDVPNASRHFIVKMKWPGKEIKISVKSLEDVEALRIATARLIIQAEESIRYKK